MNITSVKRESGCWLSLSRNVILRPLQSLFSQFSCSILALSANGHISTIIKLVARSLTLLRIFVQTEENVFSRKCTDRNEFFDQDIRRQLGNIDLDGRTIVGAQ